MPVIYFVKATEMLISTSTVAWLSAGNITVIAT